MELILVNLSNEEIDRLISLGVDLTFGDKNERKY